MGNDKNSGEPNESKYGDATFVSLPLLKISTGKPLPGAIFLCLGHRMVRYRSKDDPIEPAEYDKLVFNRVRYIFFDEVDRMAFDRWVKNTEAADTALEPAVAANAEAAPIAQAAMDQRRAIMDIFSNPKDDKQVAAAVDVSKRVVTEFMRKPFAINNIQQLQRYAKGAVDHSVNVSMLCVFLGLRMGYSHQVILENLALGGLFHDIGKV
ncbi:MAG TPA: hypothetical protein PLH57_09810, partial [Oligoflexia bacterium]|nr:hypothetical protein [Oligoflexia bacterium]